MKKYIFIALLGVLVLGGCSAKEFNEGVDSITSDVSNKFEDGQDKSSK